MARLPRLELPGWPHLIVQRVQAGQLLAKDDEDRRVLVRALKEAAHDHQVAIHAYVLQADRFYLLATPAHENGLGLAMQALGRRYVAGFNRRHARQGGLWSGRYRSVVIEPVRYLLDAMTFVEQASLRSGEISRVEDDLWSSSGVHLGLRPDHMVTDHPLFWALGNTPFDREAVWRHRLQEALPASLATTFEQATHKGWALMDASRASQIESLVGRRVTPRARGRPKKRSI